MLTHDYTLICEQARMDAGGKWIIIGLFPNGIGTPSIPFPLPTLTLFQAFKADSAGEYKFNAALTQLDNGRSLAKAQGAIQVGQAGPVIVPLPLANLQFTAFGVYTWSLEVVGQSEPFLTAFKVEMVNPQFGFMRPGGMPSF